MACFVLFVCATCFATQRVFMFFLQGDAVCRPEACIAPLDV